MKNQMVGGINVELGRHRFSPTKRLVGVEIVLRLKDGPVEVRNPDPADLGELQIVQCTP